MGSINFSQQWGGKIFMDTFGTVRPHDPERFYEGKVLDVLYKKQEMGKAEIVAIRTFEFKQIRDVLSFLDTGRPAHYLAGLLQRFYGNSLQPDSKLDHIVLRYTCRNITNQGILITQWWDETVGKNIEQQSPSQKTLFDESA
jgi:hypothetical protein